MTFNFFKSSSSVFRRTVTSDKQSIIHTYFDYINEEHYWPTTSVILPGSWQNISNEEGLISANITSKFPNNNGKLLKKVPDLRSKPKHQVIEVKKEKKNYFEYFKD